jgi:hypothetical protein
LKEDDEIAKSKLFLPPKRLALIILPWVLDYTKQDVVNALPPKGTDLSNTNVSCAAFLLHACFRV